MVYSYFSCLVPKSERRGEGGRVPDKLSTLRKCAVCIIFSAAFVWLSTIVYFYVWWSNLGNHQLFDMGPNEKVAYVSDVAAEAAFQQQFIVVCLIYSIVLLSSVLGVRWLRHQSLRKTQSSLTYVVISILTVICATVVVIGFGGLSIDNIAKNEHAHMSFLYTAIGGAIIMSIFMSIEHCLLYCRQRKGTDQTMKPNLCLQSGFLLFMCCSSRQDNPGSLGPQQPTPGPYLSFVFTARLVMSIIMIVLGGVFAVGRKRSFEFAHDGGAKIEWIIAGIMALYLMTFAFDMMSTRLGKEGQQQNGSKADV